jgi:hypothetical protein
MNKPQPYSTVRNLKERPEEIASKFVQLTPETVGAFLQKYRWRILLPARDSDATKSPLPSNARVLNPDTIQWDVDASGKDAPGQFQGDERETDPGTGEPIPGTRRTLKTWMPPKTMQAIRLEAEAKAARLGARGEAVEVSEVPLRPCKKCGKPTRHILMDVEDEKTHQFHRLYVCEPCRNARMQDIRDRRTEISKRQEETTLLKWSALLAGMWTREGASEARLACEDIFAAERPAVWNENLQQWSRTLTLECSAIRIAQDGLRFERRDLLDVIAWTILEASRRGFLRQCKCSVIFVAYSSTHTYCCSAWRREVDRRNKRRWAQKSRALKRGQHAA